MIYVYIAAAMLVGGWQIKLMNAAADAPRSKDADEIMTGSVLTFVFLALSVYLVLRGWSS